MRAAGGSVCAGRRFEIDSSSSEERFRRKTHSPMYTLSRLISALQRLRDKAHTF